MFFGRNGIVLDHPLPIGTPVKGQYYCALLQDNERPAVSRKQSELLRYGVILFQENAETHRHLDVKDLVTYSPYNPDISQ